MKHPMTTKTLEKIKRLAQEEGLCDAEIARQLGINHQSVRRWRIELGIPKGSIGKRISKKRYTFYDRKTTQFMCEGTLEECAAVLGLSMSGMHSIVCRARQGTYKKYEVYEVET